MWPHFQFFSHLWGAEGYCQTAGRGDETIAGAKRERDGLQLLKESTADALLTGGCGWGLQKEFKMTQQTAI